LRSATVTCSAPGAPYLCGISAAARLTRSYPYEEINEYLRAHGGERALVERTLSYYDVVNFAPMVRCSTLLTVGLADDVCPPETAVALYEALECPKQWLSIEGCAHDAGSHWLASDVERFLAVHLRPGAATPAAAVTR
jgi:cephalosporin-C deacetylase